MYVLYRHQPRVPSTPIMNEVAMCTWYPWFRWLLCCGGLVCLVLSGVLVQVELAQDLGPPPPCLALAHLPPPVIQVLPCARTVVLWPFLAIPLHALAASATAWRPRRTLHRWLTSSSLLYFVDNVACVLLCIPEFSPVRQSPVWPWPGAEFILHASVL
jgi:hypothetical protein